MAKPASVRDMHVKISIARLSTAGLLLWASSCDDSVGMSDRDSGIDGAVVADGAMLDGAMLDGAILDGAILDGGPPMTLDESRIQPYAANRWFWQYEGRPVLLVGATDEDNVFQIDGLDAHLDELAAAGGNYVRCTMSNRDPGNLFPFADAGGGRYDLSAWNDAYWNLFEHFLDYTQERNIIVQIEVWDRFDYSRDPWLSNPFRPANNVNYDGATSGLDGTYPRHPGRNDQPFFYTVPALDDNAVVRGFQEALVAKMLSYTLRFDHVLYTMDNETSGDPAWGAYWATFIRSAAADVGVGVETTEMWDDRDITATSQHIATWDDRERYSFTDISQNNHQVGETHWMQIAFVRDYLSTRGGPMPMNAVKIYGSDASPYGTGADAVERYWRSLVGGMASSRFHRPTGGLGLTDVTKNQIRATRMVESVVSFFDLVPDQSLLRDRSPNEAYLSARPGRAYVVYFPAAGDVDLDLSRDAGTFELRWLSLQDASWGAPGSVSATGSVRLLTPSEGGAVAVLSRAP